MPDMLREYFNQLEELVCADPSALHEVIRLLYSEEEIYESERAQYRSERLQNLHEAFQALPLLVVAQKGPGNQIGSVKGWIAEIPETPEGFILLGGKRKRKLLFTEFLEDNYRLIGWDLKAPLHKVTFEGKTYFVRESGVVGKKIYTEGGRVVGPKNRVAEKVLKRYRTSPLVTEVDRPFESLDRIYLPSDMANWRARKAIYRLIRVGPDKVLANMNSEDFSDSVIESWLLEKLYDLSGLRFSNLPDAQKHVEEAFFLKYPFEFEMTLPQKALVCLSCLDRNKRYGIFEKVGGNWLLDRSYPGTYFWDPSVQEYLQRQIDTSRPVIVKEMRP